MAIGWFTVLKSVPWSTVIGNAPVVADGAKKLWNAVASKKAAVPETPASAESPSSSSLHDDDSVIALLQARLEADEAALADLEAQMLTSTELIKALAEQNTQLIDRVEANRIRTLWLVRAVVVLGVFAALAAVVLIVRLQGA
ncbi:MAG: hypothetical protein ABIQ60_02520 [Burkholderiaceae bacterium]